MQAILYNHVPIVSLYIPLSTYLIPDNYSLYDISRFDMFYNTLDYVFSVKCNVNLPPENIIKSISNKLTLIEYNSNNITQYEDNFILKNIFFSKLCRMFSI